jgi:hypothetical protein
MTGNNLGLCVVPVMDSIWIMSMKMRISTSEYNGMGSILWKFEIRVGFCTQLVPAGSSIS